MLPYQPTVAVKNMFPFCCTSTVVLKYKQVHTVFNSLHRLNTAQTEYIIRTKRYCTNEIYCSIVTSKERSILYM